MKKRNKNCHRSGVASLYVVIFTTIMLSIITLSFARIILSESAQTTDKELSNSAYDSALAGIEDAKVALLKYHDCISRGFVYESDHTKWTNTCHNIIYNMNELIDKDSCDVTAKILKRGIETTGEVIVKNYSTGERAKGDKDANSLVLDQAYSCVKIRKEDSEYVSYLDRDNRSKIVPLRASNIKDVDNIQFSWYSAKHYDDKSGDPIKSQLKFMDGGLKKAGDGTLPEGPFRPPVIKLQLIQVNKKDTSSVTGFKLNEMNVDNPTVGHANGNTNRGTLLFIPKRGGTSVGSKALSDSNDKYLNEPIEVDCNEGNPDYICKAKVPLPEPFRAGERDPAASFFKVSLPYADIGTDFSIKLCNAAGECKDSKFISVQAIVDSTGRAGDYYRRIESRVELVDVNFPFPEYGITSFGDLKKSFYITKNCWTEKGACNKDDPARPNNYGDI